MPKFEVTSPDGRKFVVEAPEGSTAEQARDYLRAQIEGGSAKPAEPPADAPAKPERGYFFGSIDPQTKQYVPSASDLAQRNIISNATFGAPHEIAGVSQGVRNVLRGEPFGEGYRTGRDRSINEVEEWKNENSGTGLLTSVLGGLANPASRLLRVNPQAGMARQMATSGAQGAGMGAAMGAQETAGDLGDRASGAVTGAVIGGATGTAAPPVISGIANAGRWVGDQTIGRFSAGWRESAAARKVVEALQRDGLTLAQAQRRVQELGPEAALMDVGENSRALAGSMSRAPGRGKTDITDTVTERQEGTRGASEQLQGGQYGRVSELLNDVTPRRMRASVDALDAQRATAARPLYDEAFAANQSVASDVIDNILETPAGKSALGYARTMMQNEQKLMGIPSSELREQAMDAVLQGKMKASEIPKRGIAPGLNMRSLDYVKRAFGDMESAALRAGHDNEARIIGNLRRKLVKEMDDLDVTASTGPNSVRPDGGAYARARASYAGPSELIDAIEMGNNFLSGKAFKNSDDLFAYLGDLSADAREAFRVGAVQSLRDKIGNTVVRADLTKRLMGIPDLEEKIRMAFGSDDVFRRYIRGLKNEEQLFKTYAEITGNSKTAARQAADADASTDPGAKAQAVLNIAANPTSPSAWLSGLRNWFGSTPTRLRIPEAQRDDMADMLLSRGQMGALRAQSRAPQLSTQRRGALNRMAIGAGSAAGADEGYVAP